MEQYPLTYNDWPPIIPGCDWTITLGLQADNGSPIDITTYTMSFTVYDPTGAIVADAATSGTITNGGTAGFTVTFPHSFTATLTPMVADVFCSFTVAGVISPWLIGSIQIEVKQ